MYTNEAVEREFERFIKEINRWRTIAEDLASRLNGRCTHEEWDELKKRYPELEEML